MKGVSPFVPMLRLPSVKGVAVDEDTMSEITMVNIAIEVANVAEFADMKPLVQKRWHGDDVEVTR